MVQRKVLSRHAEDGGVESSDALRSLKPSSVQNAEGRNRGAEFRKKMKKSGPVKQSSPGVVPNYMKSTSSSVAKKEGSQVVGRGAQGSDGLGGVGGLKKVRALRKNLSFRPGRCLMKKRTAGVLGENLDARRGTCSSTLKDCKHPTYLLLNHGGTEAEGTSVMKVCPYTYCSLNGHRHAPLPPLKTFLSSRRRLLKAQKPENFQKNGELGISTSLSGKGQNDFFIEIYSGEGDAVARDVIDRTVIDNTLAQDYEQVTESISVSSTGDCADLNEILDENKNEYATDMDADEYLEEEVDDEIWDEFSADILPGYQLDELDSEECDMSCEAYEDVDFDYLPYNDEEPDFRPCEIENSTVQEVFISKPVDSCCGEFLADQASLETLNKKITISDTSSSNGDCESVVSFEYGGCCSNLTPVEGQEEVPKATCEDDCDILPEALKSNPQTSDTGMGCEDDEFFLDDPVEEMVACVGEAMADAYIFVDLSHQASSCEDDRIQVQESFDSPIDFADEPDSMQGEQNPTKAECHLVLEVIDAFVAAESDTREHCLDASASRTGAFLGQNLNQDFLTDDRFSKETRTYTRPIQECEEEGQFNPREPNFLPLIPAPEAEKVDLRHQELDEKKNAEEWMVDYVLRQTVTKLGPARKKKVALLVEAFEKVMPTTKCEVDLRHTSAFDHERPIQACN